MNRAKRKIYEMLAAAIASAVAPCAMAAAPVILGGGETIIAPLIGASSIANSEIYVFGTAEGTFTYYPTGTAAAQSAFLNDQPTYFAPSLTGTVDFAMSGAALTTAQINAYRSGRATVDGALIQIPYVVTPITIPIVNGPPVKSTTTPQTTPNQAHSIALNDDDLCGIFSGKITNWNQVSNPETGSFYATQSLPITVVYRADGSGATELLTRHLAAVCTTSNTAVGVTFVDGLVFANNFPDQTVPFNFVSANSDAGIRSTLLGYQSSSTAPAAVAYLSPSYTNSYLAPSSSFAAPAVAVASLLNGNDRRFYAPTAANATLALGNVVPPSKQFTAGNPANWVPPIANPISGYPVSGTSQIIISQCYTSSAVTSAIHDFLTAHYTNATFASIVRGNGFDVIPSFYQRAIQADFLSNASGFNLDIGNAAACASLGR